MDFDEFELLPRKLGWKYEYWDGKPHITPAECVVCVTMPVMPRAVNAPCPLRPIVPEDRPALRVLFDLAFRESVEYFGWSDAHFQRSAKECLDRYFANKREAIPSASRLALEESSGEVIGAALVIRNTEARRTSTF